MLRGVVVDLIVDQEVDHLAVDLAALVLVGGRTSDAKVKRRVHFWQRWFQATVVSSRSPISLRQVVTPDLSLQPSSGDHFDILVLLLV